VRAIHSPHLCLYNRNNWPLSSLLPMRSVGFSDTSSGVRVARSQSQSADSAANNKGAMRYWILYNRTIHTSAGGSETAHAGGVYSISDEIAPVISLCQGRCWLLVCLGT
jgi:hypothetical protein